MAEIRTHKPSTSAIARAIEEAMGAPVRPVAPGGGRPAGPSQREESAEHEPSSPHATGVGAAVWTGFTVPASAIRGSGTGEASGDDETGGECVRGQRAEADEG